MFSEEILINCTDLETRVAVVEQGILQEIHLEQADAVSYVGSIFKGKVIRVLPGMQSAFVDIGLERSGFIHAADLDQPQPALGITELLREGQSLIVQVIKDPYANKGARLTTRLSFSSGYLVMLPAGNRLGISQKITDITERLRLQSILLPLLQSVELQPVELQPVELLPEQSQQPVCLESDLQQPSLKQGLIVRTAAEGVAADILQKDLLWLQSIWEQVEKKLVLSSLGKCIYSELPLPLRAVRDLLRPQVKKIWIDNWQVHIQVVAFLRTCLPNAEVEVEYYSAERPLFDLYQLDQQIQQALERQVPLPSGGYLVIDQNEAMTTIDVNTGAYVGARTLEETLFKTNQEACLAIARQLRLRNLGGIIIVDFIDMQDAEHRAEIVHQFEQLLSRDRVKTSIAHMSPLGLIEMTRKRTRQSLASSLCTPCPHCQARGFIRKISGAG